MIIDQALSRASAILTEGGIEAPRAEARILLGHVIGASREELLLGHKNDLAESNFDELMRLASRRAAREPIAYLTGEREFWGLSFGVTRDTLIPRPESETLIEAALVFARKAADGSPRILDIGTGSGCLLISLLCELPGAEGVATDTNFAALAVAKSNAARHGVASRANFIAASWGGTLTPAFDIIVANPPYIAEGDRASLMPDVAAYEPAEALFAGISEMDAYRALAPDLARLVAPGGRVIIELGEGLGSSVATLFAASDLEECGRREDLAGIERCAIFSRAKRPVMGAEING